MHLTDDQLNEYLDNETAERAQIESHLDSCGECAGRLATLQNLFAEIESLPELALTKSLAARFVSTPNLTHQLPRFLTLTATLQAAVALIAIIVAVPFVTNLIPAVQMPSFTDVFFQLQSQWMSWLAILSSFQMPSLPEIPALEISSIALSLTLAGVSVLWLVGNGLLLRKQS